VRVRSTIAKLLIKLALLCCLAGAPTLAQQVEAGEPTLPQNTYRFRAYLMLEIDAGYPGRHARLEAANFERSSWSSSPNTIQRMEAAFYCNDTPFVDQVRFPLGTLWRGRVKLVGFESDVTTANFVLGLPGQGSLHSLSAFGNAFLATHTPPSDQLAGIHMTFSWKGNDVDPDDNSGWRGVEYLVRASRSFLPFLNARSDSVSTTAR